MNRLSVDVRQAIAQAQAAQEDPLALFVYDLDALAEHARQVMAELPQGVELYYAIKANSEAPILRTLAPLVSGFEISSGGEIERLQGAGSPLPFVFSGPGKLDSDLRAAIGQGVSAIHLESLSEIPRVQLAAEQAGRVQRVFIRVNPELPAQLSSRLAMAGTATPFGLDESEVAEAIRRVQGCSHLELQGFHVHALSHQQQVERHEQLLDLYLERWAQWKALAPRAQSITHLNVGGGIGVDYLGGERFAWARLCRHLERRLDALADRPVLRFEPGRFISAYCGYYAIEVLDIKTSHGKRFVVCRGGTHQFRLPVAQGHDHPIIHLPAGGREPTGPTQPCTVVGQLCTPKDVLSRDWPLAGVEVGDVLVLPMAGAYGYNISHADFLCHPRPLQCFLPVLGGQG